MLLLLLKHLGKLQGPVVGMLNRSNMAQLRDKKGPEESYQGGPGGTLSL